MRISDWSSDVCSSDLRLQHGDNLARIDEREAAAEKIDAATARSRARKLEVERLPAFLGKARPDIAERIIAGGLSFISGGARHIGRAARIGEEAVHLGANVGARGPCDCAIRDRTSTRLNSSHSCA